MTLADPPFEERTDMTDLKDLQTELASLVAGVRRVQDRVRLATNVVDERARKLQSKVEELEAENLTRALEMRELKVENAELCRQLEANRPDLAAAIAARDDALKKLEQAGNVIERLVRDHEGPRWRDPNAANANHNDPRSRVTNQPLTTVSAPGPRHPMRPQREVSIESDDEATVRPQYSSGSTHARTAKTPPTGTLGLDGIKQVSAPAATSSFHETGTVDSPTRPATRSKRLSSSAPRKRLQWYLEFANSFSTAEVQHGPIPFDVLAKQLVLDEDAVAQVGSLEHITGYDSRIHVDGDLAFVYRPVILDGTSGTYLIGWGDANMVRNVKRYMKEAREMYLFCYPAKEESGWFYVGLQRFSYGTIDSVWPELSKEDKEHLCAELKERNPDMHIGQFKKDVKAGKLLQCCIRLESVGKKVESHEFLRKYRFLDADG